MPADLRHKTAPRLWIHAASVGEVMAATPVVRLFKDRLPEWEIIISTITPGGHETATKLAGQLTRSVVYLPFDLPGAVGRAMSILQPDVLAILETELWPNLIYHARRRGARTVLINGRISDRSIGRYRRATPLFRWALAQFDMILAQSERDADRLRLIGGEPDRISVLGNTKFDEAGALLSEREIEDLRRELKLPDRAAVLVVGSTRVPQEERSVLHAYRAILERHPNLVLIHAPRHVERAGEVVATMREFNLNPILRSTIEQTEGPVQHLVLDTFGELGRVYALADVVYIGNSLHPPGGGQNLLQPLAQGKPVIHGPNMANFRDITAMAAESGVAWQVRDQAELCATLENLLNDESLRLSVRDRAVALVKANRGAAARYAEAVISLAENKR